ncbi:MAG TPA: GTP cyclohydrolase MptA [Candidatus Eremiobacteraceae bacterium]|nr:GTP cyclohydrolase MptA [Candidatus Eremiobacteraceae bacterium]
MTTPSIPVAIAIGSNLGDRQGNAVAALQRVRSFVSIDRISPAYITTPVGYIDQPDFLNLALVGRTALPAHALKEALRDVERLVGRSAGVPLGPRVIDLDLLLYGDAVIRDEDLQVPHHGLRSRAFVLVPLAEIAPDWRDPETGCTIGELAARADKSGVRRCEGGLLPRFAADIQDSRPAVALALDRAGVTGVKTLISLGEGFGRQRTAIATFDIYADLSAARSGVHMSRFSQDLEDVLGDVAATETRGVGELAQSLAERVVASQKARSAVVDARAEIALPRNTPASALATHEFYTVLAKAVVAPGHVRRMIGVEAHGITACPCAQAMVEEQTRARLAGDGFSSSQIERIMALVPTATHNQRGVGTLLIGADRPVDVSTLVEIVEQSMSSETYDLLKRPDELFVVNKAHGAPRFVEDVVREMLRYAVAMLGAGVDDGYVLARQVNYESIHKHDAVAETGATLSELRRELAGEKGVMHTPLERWLYPDLVVAPAGATP